MASSSKMRRDWVALSSATTTRPPAPFSRPLAPSMTPIRRPEASRWRSSSITSFRRVSERTRANSVTSSIGLVRKSSAPASSPVSRSRRPSSAVTITTGMWRVAVSARSLRHTSKPSISGIITSSRMMSGLSSTAALSASGPFRAVSTS